MSNAVIVGHAGIRLRDIAPERSPAYSPNLYRWMRRHAHFFAQGGVHESVYRVRADSAGARTFGAGTLLIGAPYSAYEGDTDFSGTRLMAVLCQGVEASSFCNVGVAPSLEVIDGFWDRYLEVGRCAIDPDHREHFHGGNRYQVDGASRTCLWCGVTQRLTLQPRIVHDELWVSA